MRLWLLLGTAVACTQTGQFDEAYTVLCSLQS